MNDTKTVTSCFSGDESEGGREEVQGADEEVEQGEEDRNPDQSVEPRSDAGLDPVVGRRKREIRRSGGQRESFADLPHPASEVLPPLLLFEGHEVGRRLHVADVGLVVAGSDVIAAASEVNLIRRIEVDIWLPVERLSAGLVVVAADVRSPAVAVAIDGISDVDVRVGADPDQEPPQVGDDDRFVQHLVPIFLVLAKKIGRKYRKFFFRFSNSHKNEPIFELKFRCPTSFRTKARG